MCCDCYHQDMKNPAFNIAPVFLGVGVILIAVGGFLYYQGANAADITPLELWLGPAITGGIGLIFLIIGAVLYSTLKSLDPHETDKEKDEGINNFNPHSLP